MVRVPPSRPRPAARPRTPFACAAGAPPAEPCITVAARDAALLLHAACESPPAGGLLGPVVQALRSLLPGVELVVVNWTTLDAPEAQRRRWRARG